MAAPVDTLRRRLLLTAGGLTASGLVPRLSSFTLPHASAQAASEYRALVCVFLYGGPDSNDMVVPLDDYGPYQAVRRGSGMGLAPSELVPITPTPPGPRLRL